MGVYEVAVIAVLFFAAATLYSCVGHAGASAYLAVMALASVTPGVMKPTALALNILVASIASVRFYQAGCFSWSLFWPFALASVPAAFLGGALHLPGTLYERLVGLVLVYAAYRLFRGPARITLGLVRPPPRPLAFVLGALIGLLSGVTGVGGGIFLSPLVLLAGWADPRHTAGVSAVFILVNSVSGLTGQLAATHSLPPAVIPWAVAAAAGGVLGSGIGSRRLGAERIRRVLAVVLVVASVKLLTAELGQGISPSAVAEQAPAGGR